MNGAEVWGNCKWLHCIEQVQLRASGIFLGLAGYIPRQTEMGLLPLKWEAKKRCIGVRRL